MQLPDLKVFHLTRVGAAPGQAVFVCDELLGEQAAVIDATQAADLILKYGEEIDRLKAAAEQPTRPLHVQVRDLERNYALLLAAVKACASEQSLPIEFVQDYMSGWDVNLRGMPSKTDVLRFALLSILGSDAIDAL